MIYKGDRIASRWRIIAPIGKGTFGIVFSATDSHHQLGREKSVIKFELFPGDNYFNLQLEHKLLQHVYDNATGTLPTPAHIPIIQPIYCGTHQDQTFMVTAPLGKTLEHYRIKNNLKANGRFKYLAVYQTAIQLITALEFSHTAGIAHMDIKLENIITDVSSRNKSRVFLNDFGLAIRFINPATGKWSSEDADIAIVGTEEFSALKAMTGKVCGPKDDLESLGYNLIYMIIGELAWTNMQKQKIMELKQRKNRSNTCDHLETMKHFFQYIDRLKWGIIPDYDFMRSLFINKIESMNRRSTERIDWTSPKSSTEGFLSVSPGRSQTQDHHYGRNCRQGY